MTTSRHSDDGRESLSVLVLPAVVAAGAVLLGTLPLAPDLPDQIVTGQGPGGEPRLESPWVTALVIVAVIAAGTAVLTLIRRRIGPPSAQRLVGGLTVGLPVFLAALHLLGLRHALTSPDTAPGFGTVAVALAAGGVAALVASRFVRPTLHEPTPLAVTSIPVVPGEAVVWSGRTAAPSWLRAVSVAVLAVGALLVAFVEPIVVGIVVMVVGAAALQLLSARVTAGPAGLEVRMGPLGVPRLRVPLERITGADAIEVEPLAHGGWGLRMMPGLRAVVFGHRPGLRVTDDEGTDTVVTIDDAEVAVGVLRAHLATSGQPRGDD